MKKILVILIVFSLFTGCTSKKTTINSADNNLFKSGFLSKDKFLEKTNIESFLDKEIKYLITKEKVREDDAILEYADLLMNNYIVFDPIWEPFKIENIKWDEDPYNHASWVLYYQSLNFIPYLVKAYDQTSDEKYIEKASEYILNWIKFNKTDEEIISDFTWNDHGTANRVNNIIHFLSVYRNTDSYSESDYADFVYSLYQHGLFMSNNDNYVKSNHGIMQDQSLLQLSLLFSDFPDSEEWYQIGLNRLEESMLRDVTSEGVHTEHSPTYHIFVQNLFKQANSILKANDKNIPEVMNTVKAMDEYLKYIKTPSGYTPQIGDTVLFKNNHFGGYTKLPEKVYPESGVGFLNNAFVKKDDEPDIYLMFINAYNSSVHKHKDELSFVLSIDNSDYFVDGGYYNYNKGRERSYFVSPTSHNTLTLNDTAWLFNKEKIGTPNIDSFYLSDKYSYIRGSHTLYDDSTIIRTIIYLKPGIFIIHDIIDTDNEEYTNMQQLFNIGKDIEITGNIETLFTLKSKIDDSVVYLETHSESILNINKYYGSEEPFIGWQSYETDQIHPINTLILSHNIEDNKEIFTSIKVNNDYNISYLEYDDELKLYTISIEEITYSIPIQ